ncbi:hypothetical protein CLPU_12c00120 [Gottschalkia purinilytica]|uniref:Uncharacterized protein n=1 Tax=Gottschalkia purinilytica TaxID=1503 RepID=A0A0L0W860_GOTPU|nr:DUF5667 domain-containing protein [Gottschalkia purinilytica]KNF07739.1 hypothetical protein CLPU_12c00120 [Gottschalkia purinilytica]
MKITSAIIATLLVATSLNVNAEEVTTLKDKAGVTPDSILYTMDTKLDNLKVQMASAGEEKVNIISEVAEERLGESQVMAEKGKQELVEETVNQYNEKLDNAIKELTNINSNLDEKEIKENLEKLNIYILSHQEKSIEVLNKIKNYLEGNAKETISKVIEMQKAKKEAVANMVEKRHKFNAAKKALRMAQNAMKKAEESGNEELIKVIEQALKSRQEEYDKAKEEFRASFEEKQSVVKKFKKLGQKDEENKEEIVEEEPAVDNSTNSSEEENTTPIDTNNISNSSKKVVESNNIKVKSSNQINKKETNKEDKVKKVNETKIKEDKVKKANETNPKEDKTKENKVKETKVQETKENKVKKEKVEGQNKYNNNKEEKHKK